MRLSTITLFIALIAHPALASAHGERTDGPELHAGDAYQSCYFDLHSELTHAELREFAAEGGNVARFHQVDSARTLGQLNFELALGYSATPIDDGKGAWNHTFSHPEDDHWLGEVQAFPRLTARMGATNWLDFGVWGSVNPESNYGFFGIESKAALLRQDNGWPVDLAIRPNGTHLVGPGELRFWTAGVDASVSRTFFGLLAPYLGVGGATSVANERSDEVDLDTAIAVTPVGFVGAAFNWKFLSAGVEAELSAVPTYSLRIGGRF